MITIDLLLDIIYELEKIGIKIYAMVSDIGTCVIRFYHGYILGINTRDFYIGTHVLPVFTSSSLTI
uniref:Uncharacterized protein n=1 Tax=Lepeophtheirus salmonis TaxID=72036 RepID=A0A0K2V9H4_LEPSM